jgi:Na+/H+ antiporter NhaD/arsenite permease-like protein
LDWEYYVESLFYNNDGKFQNAEPASRMESHAITLQPFSVTGLTVLGIFTLCMAAIVLEAKLHMDKFKPALLMLLAWLAIGLHYYFSGDDPARFEPFLQAQEHNEIEVFGLIGFMAFMWMIVEILAERNVFVALNGYLLRRGLGATGLFWATGALSALLSPFVNNITTAMIFGKSIKQVSENREYTHVALCNIILASNSGVWFLGTATSLMVVLAGKISIVGLMMLAPAGLIGWAASAWVLQTFYLQKISDNAIGETKTDTALKPGARGLIAISVIGLILAVLMNVALNIKIETAIGMVLGAVTLYCWQLKKKRGQPIQMLVQLQKVEWNTLMFFIGIISGVAALNHAGWLTYISHLFEAVSPTWVNIILGVISGILDNVPVEAAALMSNPKLTLDQWALNALMVGIGGSLTIIGSAAGVMVMSIDKSYTFGTHLKYLPAILVNFFTSLAVWYVQFHWLMK